MSGLPDIVVESSISVPLICDLEGYTQGHRIVKHASTDIYVIIEGNISGFYEGWLEELLEPFGYDDQACSVSANLLRLDGTPAYMRFYGNAMETWTQVPAVSPGCIAVKRSVKDGHYYIHNKVRLVKESDGSD